MILFTWGGAVKSPVTGGFFNCGRTNCKMAPTTTTIATMLIHILLRFISCISLFIQNNFNAFPLSTKIG